MNFKDLFQLQEKLDHYVIEENNLYNQSLLSEKLLALQVQIGKLANQTNCFKFWNHKKYLSKELVLKEYVYCLNFILSVGVEKNYKILNLAIENTDYKSTNITDQFLNLYIDLNDLIICTSKDNYQTLFQDFLSLGNTLQLSKNDIKNIYYKENFITAETQVIGY